MIVDLDQHPKIGPYILTRDLGSTTSFGGAGGHEFSAIAAEGEDGEGGRRAMGATLASGMVQPDRFLALHQDKQSSHIAYRFPASVTKRVADRQRFVEAVERASLLEHAHVQRIQQFTFDVGGQAWVIAPFEGDADGVRTLSRLLREKHGQMKSLEVERAMEQLLEASIAAHAGWGAEPMSRGEGETALRAVTHHGPIGIDEVIVDRRGSLVIELYGVARAMQELGAGGGRASIEVLRDEVRSIVEIGYLLLTGLRAEEPLIPAARLVPGLSRAWNAWLDKGLDPARGFDSAEQAMSELPRQGGNGQRGRADAGMIARIKRLGTGRSV